MFGISSLQHLKAGEDKSLLSSATSQSHGCWFVSLPLVLCAQDPANLLAGARQQKSSVKVTGTWTSSGLSTSTEGSKVQLTTPAGFSYPVDAKEGVSLYNMSSQSNDKVTSNIRYGNYKYNQVSSVD